MQKPDILSQTLFYYTDMTMMLHKMPIKSLIEQPFTVFLLTLLVQRATQVAQIYLMHKGEMPLESTLQKKYKIKNKKMNK